MTGIYKIAEIATGLCYIGQSKNIEWRWLEHHKRFPPALFTYEVLIQCPEESLNFFEKSFISGYDSHRNGFNKTIGGTSIKATHPDAETRAKLSAARKGKTLSPEHREKLSAAVKGKSLSDETRAKLSAAAKGQKRAPFSDETRARISAAKVGKTHSPETREKLVAAWARRKAKLEVTSVEE